MYLPTFTPASFQDPVGVERDQFHAALVDVVLGVVGDHARRRREPRSRRPTAVSVRAAEIVGDGLDDEARLALLQVRRLVLAGVERERLRAARCGARRSACDGRSDFEQRKLRAVLLDVRP